MPIPDYQTVMLPLLQLVADGREYALREITERLGDFFSLTPEERTELLASGQQAVFTNRIGWARTYLKKAGLLTAVRRGYVQISQRGRDVLAMTPDRINVTFLEQFPEFNAFRNPRREGGSLDDAALDISQQTPAETLELACQKLREDLAAELLQTVKSCTPSFFEKLVVDLLVKMGYGGSRREAGRALGKSGDGGIDGIINEDRLGLERIYLQAKRWEGTVGRPEIQKFAGALQGQRARKGIFITTSAFTREAVDYVARIDSKIVLIDGARLVEFMIDHGVGVSLQAMYEVQRIDSEYFSEG